jgi:ABC-type multidrug transport system ATPase subunit
MRVELHGVGKRFAKVDALVGIDLVLASGSRTALVGPNGSGKSTLVRLLMGMLTGNGSIRLDTLDPAAHRNELARRIAYVPQIAPRLWATVHDLVHAVADLRGIETRRIDAVAERFELDLRSIARRPFRALSGGMRQKVLAAMALATDADLLILDEPTASMDPQSRAAFYRVLDELPQCPTVLLCSHRLDEIRQHVDRVVVLSDGRMIWQGASCLYLAEHTESVVELRAYGERAVTWLTARGFVLGSTGWWQCAIAQDSRADLVAAAFRELGSDVVDVLARDLERNEVRAVAS